MDLGEDEIKKAVEVKGWIEGRIVELESEMTRLRDALGVVDGILKRASFRAASELPVAEPAEEAPTPKVEMAALPAEEVRDLKRTRDGKSLGRATITKDRMVITPDPELKLSSSTPPFKTFFVNRILEGMKARDLELVSQKKLSTGEVLSHLVEEEGGTIKRIAITNYRDKSRLNELINTVSWAFTRMLERAKGKEEKGEGGG